METKWRDNFIEGKELILATASKDGIPNANVVISCGFFENELLMADCQMNTTIKNLEENPIVCIIGGYYKLKGVVSLFSLGEKFDLCVRRSNGFIVKNAIAVKIEKIFDLDKNIVINDNSI